MGTIDENKIIELERKIKDFFDSGKAFFDALADMFDSKPCAGAKAPEKKATESTTTAVPEKKGRGRPPKAKQPEEVVKSPYEGKTARELHKMCESRSIKAETKQTASYYIEKLEYADEQIKIAKNKKSKTAPIPIPDEDEDDWDNPEDEDDDDEEEEDEDDEWNL